MFALGHGFGQFHGSLTLEVEGAGDRAQIGGA
jgi:hypothetical protein